MPNSVNRWRALSALAACVATATIGVPVSQAQTGDAAAQAVGAAAVHGPDRTSHAYFVAVLSRMHLPVTQSNLDGLYAVEHREGDNNRYNPLNVVQPEPGSQAYNSIGVQRYASFGTGVAGTAHLLGNGHWTRVRTALRKRGSTSAVLAAFSAAYTWSGGIHFQTDRPLLEAEAVRDVGGKYASPALAMHRAHQQQSGLHASIGRLSTPMNAALSAGASAHLDWAVQRTNNLTAVQLAAGQSQVAGMLATRAARERQLFVGAITSQYMSGGSAASVGQLLDSSSPADYMSYLTLQSYVTTDQRRVLRRYAAMRQDADTAAAALARTNVTVRTTSTAMMRDRHTWTTSDTEARRLRSQLITVLSSAMRNSITQPVAVDELAKIHSTQPAARGERRHRAKHVDHHHRRRD